VTEEIRAGRRRVAISHARRVLFPETGLTKLDLARYYAEVAEAMVPHVRDRPLALHSFPEGIDGAGYFQKDRPHHFPDWVPTARVPRRAGGTVTQVLGNDAATLAYLAGQNAITPHIWTARADRLEQPDRIVFDLDPSPTQDFAEVRAAARALGELLRDLGLEPFAMTTGSRGLHVDVALRRGAVYEDVHAFARAVAERLADRHPAALTVEVRRDRRGERIFLDTGRNAYAQHAVAPYAIRARSGAPVATPLVWDELSDERLDPRGWTLVTIGDRLAETGDPWARITRGARELGPARRALERERA
jgi:bifunctional non-homologous end joining protein LigD